MTLSEFAHQIRVLADKAHELAGEEPLATASNRHRLLRKISGELHIIGATVERWAESEGRK